jgi:hypothetical protein
VEQPLAPIRTSDTAAMPIATVIRRTPPLFSWKQPPTALHSCQGNPSSEGR